MSRYTEFYLLVNKNDIEDEKMLKAKQFIKLYEEMYNDVYIIISEKWKLIKGAKILFGEDFEIEKYFREYNVYARNVISIIKAVRSLCNTNYYRDTKRFQLTEVIHKLLDVLR